MSVRDLAIQVDRGKECNDRRARWRDASVGAEAVATTRARWDLRGATSAGIVCVAAKVAFSLAIRVTSVAIVEVAVVTGLGLHVNNAVSARSVHRCDKRR